MSSKSSTTELDEPPDTILVGRVRKPHGVRGQVLVESLSDVAERFASGGRLILEDVDGVRQEVEIEFSAPHGGGFRLGFVGRADRDDVEGLRGAALYCRRGASPPPPDGGYYYYQLVGCSCHDLVAGPLGKVVEVVEDGGGHLLRVEDGGRGLLVPFVRSMLTSVDIDAGRIEIELPEGLVEACTYRS